MSRLLFEQCSNCATKIEDEERGVALDPTNDLWFCSESCLEEYFDDEITFFENQYRSFREDDDIPMAEFSKYDHLLQLVLTDPDEIWMPEISTEEDPVAFLIGEFLFDKSPVYYVASAYLSEERPAFVFFHFPTKKTSLVEKYRKGEMIYDASQEDESKDLESESLVGTDDLPGQIYQEFLKSRSSEDIELEDFPSYASQKEATVKDPDEVWRRYDDSGNTVLVLLKRFEHEGEPLVYIAVTEESDETPHVFFGFPTVDKGLVDKFRMGEALHADEEEDEV